MTSTEKFATYDIPAFDSYGNNTTLRLGCIRPVIVTVEIRFRTVGWRRPIADTLSALTTEWGRQRVRSYFLRHVGAGWS